MAFQPLVSLWNPRWNSWSRFSGTVWEFSLGSGGWDEEVALATLGTRQSSGRGQYSRRGLWKIKICDKPAVYNSILELAHTFQLPNGDFEERSFERAKFGPEGASSPCIFLHQPQKRDMLQRNWTKKETLVNPQRNPGNPKPFLTNWNPIPRPSSACSG